MLSALLMFKRVANAFRHAVREEDFLNVFGAGALLVFIGTLVYSLDESWNVVDSLYFAVSTLTTTSVSDRTWRSPTAGCRSSPCSTS